ncbi:MAG: M23 family metallopeptidase [Anaerolineae bacterium]|nr:M23 family metallopeptidase [Anaerolineae bacterium]
MSIFARVTKWGLLNKEANGKRGMALPFIFMVAVTKIVGLVATFLLIVVSIMMQFDYLTIATGFRFPVVHFDHFQKFGLNLESFGVASRPAFEASLTPFLSASAGQSSLPIQVTSTPSFRLSPTAIATQKLSDTATIAPSSTLTATLTLSPTLTLTPSITSTPTITPTATVTPYVLAYEGKLHSPLADISFPELSSIVSQPYIRIYEARDTGHYGVDLGSYDYKGKMIYDWPVMAVFAGRVVSVVNDRLPLGNMLIIETTYDDLPQEARSLLGIQYGESLYHLYGHLIQPPALKIGERVLCGQRIGAVGKSKTVEAHLHLEMRIGTPNVVFDGMAYYETNATDQERNNYERFRMSGEFRSFDPMIIFAQIQ